MNGDCLKLLPSPGGELHGCQIQGKVAHLLGKFVLVEKNPSLTPFL